MKIFILIHFPFPSYFDLIVKNSMAKGKKTREIKIYGMTKHLCDIKVKMLNLNEMFEWRQWWKNFYIFEHFSFFVPFYSILFGLKEFCWFQVVWEFFYGSTHDDANEKLLGFTICTQFWCLNAYLLDLLIPFSENCSSLKFKTENFGHA